LKLDTQTGMLAVDNGFRDADGKVGFGFAERDWPHGWHGVGVALSGRISGKYWTARDSFELRFQAVISFWHED
jgi:hypothetical protein